MSTQNQPKITLQGALTIIPVIITLVSSVGGVYVKLSGEISDLKQRVAVQEVSTKSLDSSIVKSQADMRGSILSAREDFKTGYTDIQKDIAGIEARLKDGSDVTRTDIDALKRSVVELEYMIQAENKR